MKKLRWHAFYILTRFFNMQGFGNYVKNQKTTFSALELKQLLTLLADLPHICFRYRCVGEMWCKNLMKVSSVNESSVLLYDDLENKYNLVSLNNIIQFEIDERFQSVQPYFHYEVIPSTELQS